MTTATILRLRCVRCGDWHEREVGDPYLPEICIHCFDKALEAGCAPNRFGRFVSRYTRGTDRHPTVLALAAAWAEYAKDWPANDNPP